MGNAALYVSHRRCFWAIFSHTSIKAAPEMLPGAVFQTLKALQRLISTHASIPGWNACAFVNAVEFSLHSVVLE